MFHIYPLIHKNGKNSIKKTLLNAVVDHHVAVEIEEEQKVGQPQNSEDGGKTVFEGDGAEKTKKQRSKVKVVVGGGMRGLP